MVCSFVLFFFKFRACACVGVACHHLVTGPADPVVAWAPSMSLTPLHVWGESLFCPCPGSGIHDHISSSALPETGWRTFVRGYCPLTFSSQCVLGSWGTFHKVSLESLALRVLFDNFLRSCLTLNFHIHKFVIKSICLVKTLTILHKLKILSFDSL
mgnify:CR=1 FL=1